MGAWTHPHHALSAGVTPLRSLGGCNQRKLPGPVEPLDPGLLAHRGAPVGHRRGERELDRQPACRIAAGPAGSVVGEPSLNVGAPPGVKRSVGAAQHVYPRVSHARSIRRAGADACIENANPCLRPRRTLPGAVRDPRPGAGATPAWRRNEPRPGAVRDPGVGPGQPGVAPGRTRAWCGVRRSPPARGRDRGRGRRAAPLREHTCGRCVCS